MLACPHEGCGYAIGWTHHSSEHNYYLDPPEGNFFEVLGNGREGAACRWDGRQGGISHMLVLGCPKCFRMFVSKDEVYLD